MADESEKIGPSVGTLQNADDVVLLSPFEVTSGGDRGYQAGNSLGGSRLATSLKDIASPTSAFTSQFFEDAAITNIDDLAQFMLSTEYDYGEASGGQNRLNGLNKGVRVRGMAGGTYAVNFFRSDLRFDTFSLDRVDQSRGPNSVLFGVGDPGGIINVTTKRALLNNAQGYVSIQGKSYEGLREEIDYNQPLIKGKLAVRFAAVDTKAESWRNYEFNDETRYFATANWKIGSRTQLNVEVEKGNIVKQTKRTVIGYDAYTNWVAAGSHLGTAVSAANQIQRIVAANQAWITFDTATGTIQNWVRQFASTRRQSVDGDAIPITDFSLLPNESTFYGPGYDQATSYVRSSAYLTQALTRNWHLEFAALRLDSHGVVFDPQNAAQNYLSVDVNATMPNGQPNPNAGKPYLESLTQRNQSDNRSDTLRLSSSYQTDFGVFGKHTIAAVHQQEWQKSSQIQARETVISANAPDPAVPDGIKNRFNRRTYVDLSGPSANVVMRNFQDQPISNLGGYTVGFIPFNQNTQLNSSDGSSTIGMIQSSFWRDRIHTVLGGSYDQSRSFRGTQVRLPFEHFTDGIIAPVRSHAAHKSHARSVSVSGVFQATGWLGLTYSQSENSALPNFAGYLYSPDGTNPYARPPTPRGKSRDFGLKLDLWDHRVFLTAVYFRTSDEDDFDFTPRITPTINVIWNTLQANNVPIPSGYTYDPIITLEGGLRTIRDLSTGATFGNRTHGIELELTANPTPNWRLFANYSHQTTVSSNIGPELQAYVALRRPLWLQYGDLPMSNGLGTVADQVAAVDNAVLSNYILADGNESLGQMRDKFSGRTTYDFNGGMFKGVSIGGAGRYQSAPVIGYFAFIDAGGNRVSQVYRGAEQIYFDANVAFRRKIQILGKSVNWSLQLNINNVFDNDAYQRLKVSNANETLLYRFNRPLEWILTSKFAF